MNESGAEVFDLGYQHYDGPREGRMRARKTLFVSGVRSALGLGRSARAKIVPGLLFIGVIAPALIITLAVSVTGPDEEIPGHNVYYQVVSIFLLLFSAIIAPELLCPDRRNRVISLYLVRPITASDYVAGRWLAFLSVTLVMVYSGQVILFAGFTLAADEPWEYLRGNWLDVPRFLGAGLVVAAFTTTLPMAVSAFTTRRAYAAAFAIGLFAVSAAAAGVLTSCDEEEMESTRVEESAASRQDIRVQDSQGQCPPLTGSAAKWFALLDVGRVPIHVSDLIFAEDNDSQLAKLVKELPDAIPVVWYLLLTLGPASALLWRYQRIRV